MSPEPTWQRAFLAVSAVVGEPLPVAVAALGGEQAAGEADLLRDLSAPSRETRARAAARVMAAVVAGLDGAEAP